MVVAREALLIVEDLQKIYSSGKKEPFTAVDGISFTVSQGECFGLLGPNGAGKSTTMKCITGFYPLNRGRVLIRGINIHDEPKRARRTLGVCSQDDTLDTDFSVIDQMITYASYFGIDKYEAKKRADNLLKRFGLDVKALEDVEALSGGMRRRLQVARALISDPEVLVLDEPTTGLDPEVRRELWDIISENREKGISILLSTHYMEEAERLCDRVAIMHNGKILDCASPRDLINKHIGTEDVQEELRPGVTWKRPPNLEDVYMKLAGRGLDKD
jgi:lipooligosaccharide transport system ATP-binding protein